MSAAKKLKTPVIAATLLAGLVLPAQAETEAAAPHEPAHAPAKPLFVINTHPAPMHVAPQVKKVTLKRVSSSKRYRVKRGDCLWTISRAYLGHGRKWRVIYQANRDRIHNPNLIYPGQMLRLPRRPYAVQSKRERHSHARSRVAHRSLHTVRVSDLSKHAVAPNAHGTHQPTTQHFAVTPPTEAPAKPLAHDLPPVAKVEDTRHALEAAKLTAAPEKTPAAHEPPHANPPKVVSLKTQAPKSYGSHRRINGSFYSYRDDALVWADDGTPVQGKQVQAKQALVKPTAPKATHHVAERVTPVRQAPAAAPLVIDDVAMANPIEQGPVAAQEPSIQGHRRINGSFFLRRGALLLWADTLEPVRNQATPEVMVAP